MLSNGAASGSYATRTVGFSAAHAASSSVSANGSGSSSMAVAVAGPWPGPGIIEASRSLSEFGTSASAFASIEPSAALLFLEYATARSSVASRGPALARSVMPASSAAYTEEAQVSTNTSISPDSMAVNAAAWLSNSVTLTSGMFESSQATTA